MIQLWLSTSWWLNERSKKGKIMAPLSCSLSSGLAVSKQVSWIIFQIFSLVKGPLRPCNSSETNYLPAFKVYLLKICSYMNIHWTLTRCKALVPGPGDTKECQDKHKWKSTCSRSCAWSRTNFAPLLQETGRQVLVEVQNVLWVTKSTTEYRNALWGKFLFFRPISRMELAYQLD